MASLPHADPTAGPASTEQAEPRAPTAPEARSRPRRMLLMAAGSVCLGLGAVGALLPVLPTTPFVLLAAACFARSSRSFHRALRESRLFGPVLRDWEDHRSIPRAARLRAITVVVVVFALTVTLALEATAARLAMGLLGVGLVVFLARLPTTPEEADEGGVPRPSA
jgi:uncharacterized membrane protein YbaN (DUF454 family)